MPAISDLDILVLGSINQDVISHTSRLPGPGETIGGGLLSRQSGGKGANQAVAAARLGARVRLVGALGRDESGRRIRAELEDHGVDISAVKEVDVATGTALIMVDDAGENQIAVCSGANAEIEIATDLAAQAQLILTQLEVPLPTVLAAAKAATGFFALNASPARPLPEELLSRCDLIIVNEAEYAELPALAPSSLLAVTYGAEGSALLQGGKQLARIPAHRATVVSTVGAGDSFCAALTLGIAAGAEPATALRIASAAGADAVSSPASQPPLQRWEAYRDALS